MNATTFRTKRRKKIIEQALLRLDSLGSVHATITPNRLERRQKGRRAKGDEEEMFTLTAQDLHGVIQSVYINNDSYDCCTDTNYGYGISHGDVKKSKKSHLFVDGTEKVLVEYNRIDGIGKELEIAHTLNASDWRGLNRNQNQNAVVEGYRVRKLTPREYARLQGFPDSFSFHVSDTQLYKQFGNAVTVPVAKALAESIKEFLTDAKTIKGL